LQSAWVWWPLLCIVTGTVVWLGGSALLWAIVGVPTILAFSLLSDAGLGAKIALWTVFVAAFAVLGVPPVRRRLITVRVMRMMSVEMPSISATERQALEAGGAGWEKELFGGRPVWRRLRRISASRLTEKEQVFLHGPVEEFCGLISDHRINAVDRDLPREAWDLLRRERFMGMIIPEEYGGLGFSPGAHAAVVMKIASRSISAALTVMIPNSVGPAKLILKYGTEAQKARYLPALAAGEEIPCFALTGPEAGSDAASMPDRGVVCRQAHDGRPDVLGVRLSFDKRYISLAPISTLIGVAFKLHDPQGLLGDRQNPGITLALVPASADGVTRGERHDPMHMGFHNGPVRGEDVFVPMEAVIGEQQNVGRGWTMLMECLTDGRSISLPALSCAAAKIAARATGAYARVRYQFRVPIARFEGVQEALAQIAGHTFAMDGARQLILAELDEGRQPAVAAGIVKYNLTERCRTVLDHAMDVHAGAGAVLGPRNVIGEFYKYPPIGVTVEGANILTRSLITFGQGAIRCHPCLGAELAALEEKGEGGLRAFDRAFGDHLRLFARNLLRTFVHGLTGARLAAVPARTNARAAYRQIARLSATFALLSDVLIFTLRGKLRQRERLSARMADVLSQMYIASGALRVAEQTGPDDSIERLRDWVIADSLWRAQTALEEVFDNLLGRLTGRLLRRLVFPFGRPWTRPSDAADQRLAQLISVPSTGRDRLTAGIYLPVDLSEPMARLEAAFGKVTMTAPLAERIREGGRMELIRGGPFEERVQSAVEARVLTPSEAEDLLAAEKARREILEVDAS
jgi:acyl-CoA dehydrogenase